MNYHGNFALPRAVWTHPVFRSRKCFTGFTKLQAYSWIVSHAATHPQVRLAGRKDFPIQRGQCVASMRLLATYFDWSEGRVRRFLKALKAAGLIDSLPYTLTTVIIVKNYDAMQATDSLGDALARTEPEMVATHLSRGGRLTEGLRKISKAFSRRAA